MMGKYVEEKILLESGTNELEIVEFQIDQSVPATGDGVYHGFFGVNVGKVREIINTPEVITKMSGSPPCIEGIVELRGRIIPVINLPKWLGRYNESLPLKRIIITEFNRSFNGFLVNNVTRIHRVSWEQVEPPTGVISMECQDSITGVIKFDKKIVLILDFEKIVMELDPDAGFKKEEVKVDRKELRKGKKIFVAEDSGMVAKLIKSTLTEAGYDVNWDYNGLACWNRLTEVRNKINESGEPLEKFVSLIISDVEMPQMDGLHLLSKIRRDTILSDLPVILFSSMASEDNIRKWEGLKATEVITKPEMPLLVSRVDYHTLGIGYD